MQPIYLDLHIHTYPDANKPTSGYDVAMLVRKIKEYNGDEPFLISFTDHNTINKEAYLNAKALGVKLLLGAELHIKNHDDVDAFHCHIYYNLDVTEENIDAMNTILDNLYPVKLPEKIAGNIPNIQDVINAFDPYEFMLLPHAGQKHGQFNYSLHGGEKVDDAISRSIYYNQFDGFTARENNGLEKTHEYFEKLGIAEFVNLLTCSDNYVPSRYPEPKASETSPFVPTWMMAEPTYDGVRLSLSERSRLFYQQGKPQMQCEHISRVTLKDDTIDIDVELGEGLNVVIGGSSSGKTLFVDSLNRYFTGELNTSVYDEKYHVHKIDVRNPSEIHPYYISQNFIAEVVSKNETRSIDEIAILKKAFPCDDNVKRQNTKALAELERIVGEMIMCVEHLEQIERLFKDIPHPGKLITSEKVQKNIFAPLLPKQDEADKCDYPVEDYKTDVEQLRYIEQLVNNNPFAGNISHEIEAILKELANVRAGSDLFDKVSSIIETHKDEKEEELRNLNGHNQTILRNKEKLWEYLKLYVDYRRKFENQKKKLMGLNYSYSTKEVKAMGHTLSITNTFKFNEATFLEVLSNALRYRFSRMDDVQPENMYKPLFKQRAPKITTYEQLGEYICDCFKKQDNNTYKIVSSRGVDFYEMSPGWKSAILLDLILGYDGSNAPIIIDQPEDNLAVKYINEDLVKTIKNMKFKKQVILVSHNATIPMMADAQTIVLCKNDGKKIKIRSASLEGEIDGKKVLDLIADQTDGGKASIKKRVKKYNLKKFN